MRGPGARTQGARFMHAATAAHRGEAVCRLQRPDQDGAGAACFLADEVEAPVDAVGTVDIGIAGRAEHHRVALGAADVGMRCRVGVMIGLNLDDDAAHAIDQQCCADQLGRDVEYRTIEKRAAKAGRRGHGRNVHILPRRWELAATRNTIVMPGFMPGIHVYAGLPQARRRGMPVLPIRSFPRKRD